MIKKAKEKPLIFLSGRRLYLRPILEQDLSRCARWMNDAENRQFLGSQFPQDKISERKWFDSLHQTNPPQSIVFAIVLRRSHRHIGVMGLHGINWLNRFATTGAVIGERDCRDKGYGSEAKALVLDYAFNALNLHRINSNVLSTNPRSLAYLKRSGYTVEGRRRRMFYRNGAWADDIVLGILQSEWRTRQKK